MGALVTAAERAEECRKIARTCEPGGQLETFLLQTAAELDRLGTVEKNLIDLIYQPADRPLGRAIAVCLGAESGEL